MSGAAMRDERLLDLLARQVIEGLSAEEQAELERLWVAYPDADRGEIERVAAALALAGDFEEEPMPTELRDKVRGNAARWIAGREARVVDVAERRDARVASSVTPVRQPPPARWPWFAVAASLVIAIAGWWPRAPVTPEPQQAKVEEPPPAPAELTPAQEREALLARGTAVVQTPWSNTDDPASSGVAGDVVWDNNAQKGYMRFSGLASNDPGRFQYQLWIFDAKQDDRYPIDGGVFDVPAGATEVVVPIDAKIRVNEPVMFAVTIEKPGGVVVSAREHIVTLAKTAAG